MRIAVPYYESMIFQHFGHAAKFKVYEVENHQVLMEMIVEAEQTGHTAVAELLRSLDVRAVICGNIGQEAMQALNDAGILFYGGVTGPADEAITRLIEGKLAYDPDIRCESHDCEGVCGDCAECAGCAHCG